MADLSCHRRMSSCWLGLPRGPRSGGLKLTGEGGLLGRLTKMVIEGVMEGELDDHLGFEKHDRAGRNGGNSRNGHRAKTVLTEAGPVDISVPAGPGFGLRAPDRGQAAAAADRGRGPGDLAVDEGADAPGDARSWCLGEAGLAVTVPWRCRGAASPRSRPGSRRGPPPRPRSGTSAPERVPVRRRAP